jgi:hypothetical protein
MKSAPRRVAYFIALLSIIFLVAPVGAVFASGITWTNQTTGTSASGLNWQSITSSSDGTKLAAAIFNGDIWTSTDSGATWTNQTTGTSASGLFWSSITSSSDGTKRSTASFGPTN